MIARVWTARTSAERAPAYADHLRKHVLPGLKAIDGYRGAGLWRRGTGDEIELVVVTFWRSLDAIRRFAGDDIERAVVTGEAAAILGAYDDRVRHYDLVVEDQV